VLPVHPDVTTSYWGRVLEPNGCYADTSVLTIDVCVPKITQQPQPQTVNAGSSATLSVGTDFDDRPELSAKLTYRWYRGAAGDTSTEVGTGRQMTIQPTADATYWVRITSNCVSDPDFLLDSAAVSVRLCVPPSITQEPADITGFANVDASLSVLAQGDELSYQWYRGLAGDTSTPSGSSAQLTVRVTQSTDFWVRITGRCGSKDSRSARVSISPVITTQPAGGAVTKNITRTLTVSATGTYLTYQWYRGSDPAASVLISGATSSTLVTPAITADVSYWARVSSGTRSVDSAVATFTVCLPRTETVTYGNRTSGSSVSLYVSAPAEGEAFEWYEGPSGTTTKLVSGQAFTSVTPLATTQYWVRTKRATCDADSAGVTVVVCQPKIDAQPQSQSALSGASVTLSVTATGTGPLAYQWYLGAAGDASQPVSGATSFSYTTPPLTAARSYWVQVTSPAQTGCGNRSVNSQTANITVCSVPSISTVTPPQQSTSGRVLTFSVAATGGSLQYEWHEGAVGSGPVIGTNSPSINVAPTTTKTYWVRVYNGCGSINSSAIPVSIFPVITMQPQDTCACANSLARFIVSANGSPLSYAWYREYTGQTMTAVGSNQAYVDIAATSPAWVQARITSGTATTISHLVALTILPVPFDFSLTKKSYPSGWTMTATVDASDDYLVDYQWFKGALGNTSTPIGGVTTSTSIFVQPTSLPTTYWVRVRYLDNGCYRDKAITIQ
jgi:hypothetical protein